jgi:cell division septal protein FtsQ
VNTAPPAPPAPPQLPPDAEAARLPIDPRIRQRRIEVRRKEGRRRLWLLCAVIGSALVAAAGYGIAHSRLLVVHHVEVFGASHTSREQVLASARVVGLLMIHVHTEQVAERLDALPWVATANVSRQWPTTITIRITERTPAALVAANPGQLGVVDDTGRVLALNPAPSPALSSPRSRRAPVAASPSHSQGLAPGPYLPTVVGLEPAGPPGSRLTDGQPLQAALALVAAVRRDLVPSTTTWIKVIEVSDAGQLSAILNPAVIIRLGQPDELDAKFQALRALLAQIPMKGVATIDVRVPDAPVLTRTGGTGSVSTASRG